MHMGSQIGAIEKKDAVSGMAFFIEIEGERLPASPEAVVVMRGLIANRGVWTHGDVLAGLDELRSLNPTERKELVERAAKEIATLHFGEAQTSILMIDDDGSGSEYRLHRDLQGVDVAAEQIPLEDRSDNIPPSGSSFSSTPITGGREVRRSKGESKGASGRRAEEDDIVRIYLSEIGKIPLLTAEQEVALAKVIESSNAAALKLAESHSKGGKLTQKQRQELEAQVSSGEQARKDFINANLRLVVSIAKRYNGNGLGLLDHIQNGNIGLLTAVEKFDWRKGFKFSTYATWWIKQSITRSMANTGRAIRLPAHAAESVSRLWRVNNHLQLVHGRPVTVEELAAFMEIPEARVIKLMSYDEPQISLSAHVADNSDTVYADILADPLAESVEDEAIRTKIMRQEIVDILDCLNERERQIIVMRYGLGIHEVKTLEEVGKEFGVTRERIRQIEARALSKLRHPAVAGSKLAGML